MSVIGCDYPAGPVVGAERMIGRSGVWAKTHFRQKGHYLCATTYAVADGNPRVIELRVDLRPLMKVAAAIHKRAHQRMAKRALSEGKGPVVGWSLKKMWRGVKKTAKKIGRNKLVRGVVKVHKAVYKGAKWTVKNKYVQAGVTAALTVFPPTTAVGVAAGAAFMAANKAIDVIEKGKQVADTAIAAKRAIDKGVKTAKKVRSLARGKSKLRLTAGGKIRISAKAKARIRKKARRLGPKGKRRFAFRLKKFFGKAKSRALAAKKRRRSPYRVRASALAKARAKANIKRAARIKRRLKNPVVRRKLRKAKVQATAGKKALRSIALRARYGKGAEKLDAQKSAAIVNLVARNRARIRGMAQTHAGGLPSMLIDRRGRIIPGRFRVTSASPGLNPDVLYTGPKKLTRRGQFARVAGASVGSSPWDIVGYPTDQVTLEQVMADQSIGRRPPPPPRVRRHPALGPFPPPPRSQEEARMREIEAYLNARVGHVEVGCDDNPHCDC